VSTHGRPAQRRRARAVVCLLAAAALTLPATANAQDLDGDDTGSVRLTLWELTSALGPGSLPLPHEDLGAEGLPDPPEDLELRVLVENDGGVRVEPLRVVVEIHPAATSRDQLRDALDGTITTAPLHVHEHLLRAGRGLDAGEVAGLEDRFTGEEISWDLEGGVHPVRIAAVRGTEVLDDLVTAVVWLTDVPTSPLITAFVWPIDDVPWRTTGGQYPAAVDRALRPGGRIDVLLRALEHRPDAPVVLAAAPHLLEDLRDRADGYTALERQPDGSVEHRTVEPEDDGARTSNATLQRLRDLANSLPHPPVVSSYADADLAALVRAGDPLDELAAEAAVLSRRRLHRLLDRMPAAGIHLVGGAIDARTLDLLPAEHVLLPHTTVRGGDTGGAPVRSLRSEAGRLLTGIVADPHLSELLGDPPGPGGRLADAQRVVAETAMIYQEAPGREGRTLLLLPPELWSPDPAVLDHLLDRLSDAAWLELTGAADQAALGRRGASPLELADERVTPLDADLAGQLTTALTSLEAIGTALPPEVGSVGARDPEELRDSLLRATSRRHLGPTPSEALAHVRDVQRTVDAAFGDVVVAAGSRVTLTSDSGQIPITLQRTRGGPILVEVEVASPGRLSWPDGRRSATIALHDGEAQTVSFTTHALSTGTFPVTVRVTDPSGNYELDRTTLSVRSTAVSGPALSATAAAVLVLLLIGALRRRRRPRRPRLLLVHADQVRDSSPPTPRADD
jgi:hypothetical protein